MTSIDGKGFFIWKVKDCEGGNPTAIANAAVKAGFSHVIIKIADGGYAYNVDSSTNTDLVAPVVTALKAKGIHVWGWHYVYGDAPTVEANIAIQRIQQLNLEGYVIDAELEYQQAGKSTAATQYMTRLRDALPLLPMALSSYRFPSYHPQLPWRVFLGKVNYNMPQVYWEQAHNPDTQMDRVVSEFQALTPFRPIIPTGPAYKTGGWAPTLDDIKIFMDSARRHQLVGANFFSWDECRSYLQPVWDTVSSYNWSNTIPPSDITGALIEALNTRDPAKVANLYLPDAVHVTFARAIRGTDAIKTWYSSLFNSMVPNAHFDLTGYTGTGSSRHFNWTASSTQASIKNGNDTLGLLDGKIAYHYSYFTVSK